MSHSKPLLTKNYSNLEDLEVKSISNSLILDLNSGKNYSYLWHWHTPTMDHLIGIYIKEFQYNFAIVVASFDTDERYSQVLNPNNNSSKLWYFI